MLNFFKKMFTFSLSSDIQRFYHVEYGYDEGERLFRLLSNHVD
jgi:hypothetical protein